VIDLAAIDRHVAQHLEGWLEELKLLCRQPSVSARHEGVVECAALVAERLRSRGFQAEAVPNGAGHPVVLGAGGQGPKTLLFYNHYDVQPPEPLELWESPPFEPALRDGCLFARGAKDDKGELVARLAALDTLQAVTGSLPCRVSFLVEGEEEIGSPNLPAFVEKYQDQLRTDGAIWEEGGVDEDGSPLVSLGARGLLYVELSLHSISRDGHSGGANLLPNAAWRLIWAIASLKGPDEKIRIPGFYDRVRPPTQRQEAMVDALPSPEKSVKEQFGLDSLLLGVSGRDVRRAPFLPTCNVAGFGSGYQGEGSKTIVPARALAKLDFRLVPDQDPLDVLEKLRAHLARQGFGDVGIEVLGAERPGMVDPDAPLVRLAMETGQEVYGKPARLIPLNGGTTPMYLFTEKGVPVVAPGVGFHNANRAHSPNEFVRVADFERAVRHLARLVLRFAES